MRVTRSAVGWRAALAGAGAMGVLAAGCIERPLAPIRPTTQSGVSEEIRNDALDNVDLLLEVDNSNSMKRNQENIMAQFKPLIDKLIHPPMGPDGKPTYPPVKSLHVGVISQDLGTTGNAESPFCKFNPELGDDGLLHPLRNGPSLVRHLPWNNMAPLTYSAMECRDPGMFPNFLKFDSTTNDPDRFAEDFKCVAGLWINGCGLEQQLEAVYRALIYHDAREHGNNVDPNAGFLRDNALLAIILLTDEEDGSVQASCQDYADGQPCTDHSDVYTQRSSGWSSTDPDMRFYNYIPGGPQDPTWPLERYFDPSDPNKGYLRLKPGHPERIVFAAIAGVPIELPRIGDATNGAIDWNALLGTPDPSDVNNFYGRDPSGVKDIESAEGPISMRQANPNPDCQKSPFVVPACRAEKTKYDPTCDLDQQYWARPSRRIVEIARRFDQAPMCENAPCHNGVVTSICSQDFSGAVSQIIDKIQSQLRGKCLPRALRPRDPDANPVTVECIVREYTPVENNPGPCDPDRGRMDPTGTSEIQELRGAMYKVCDIQQVGLNRQTYEPVRGTGWYYNVHPPAGDNCAQEIAFQPAEAAPGGSGTITRLECIQSVTGVDDTATGM